MTSLDGETNQRGTLFSILFFSYGEINQSNQGGKPQTTEIQKNLKFNCKTSLVFE